MSMVGGRLSRPGDLAGNPGISIRPHNDKLHTGCDTARTSCVHFVVVWPDSLSFLTSWFPGLWGRAVSILGVQGLAAVTSFFSKREQALDVRRPDP